MVVWSFWICEDTWGISGCSERSGVDISRDFGSQGRVCYVACQVSKGAVTVDTDFFVPVYPNLRPFTKTRGKLCFDTALTM